MRSTIVLALVIAAGVAMAAPGPASNAERVKLYTGTIGSDQFIWGHATLGSPLGSGWSLHSYLPQASLMDNAATGNADSTWVVAGYDSTSTSYLFSHPVGSTTWKTDNAPPVYVTNGGCGIIGDTLYYCSGYSYTSSACIDTLQKYCISKGTWTTAHGPYTSGTTYNWQPLILACAGKLYYISGCNQPGATSPTNKVWAYAPGSGWAQVANMNQGRVFCAGWVYHDTIWVAGGSVNNSGVTSTEFYDPVADNWVVDNGVFPQLPTAVWGCASGVNIGADSAKGWIAGGVDPSSALQDTIYYFDYTRRTWSLTSGMYTTVYRSAGWGDLDGKAVVYGGSTGGFNTTRICQFEQEITPPSHDVTLSAIVAPPPIMLHKSVKPVGTVRNVGLDTAASIPVTCWIDSAGTRVYSATDTVPGPLAPGASVNDTFATAWTSGPAGSHYTVTMFTALSADSNQANDTMRRNTTITSAHDVALSAIVKPLATMNQGSVKPIGTVQNAGLDTAASIPVTCWIDSAGTRVYSATDTLLGPLAPGSSANDTFANAWTSGPSGAHYTVTMFTALSSDSNAANDTMRRNVTITGPGVQESPRPTFALYGASPSFVRGQALISYYVDGDCCVGLGVYDVSGKLVKTLVSGRIAPGERSVTWNRTNNSGRTVANGTYFYRLTVDGRSVSSKAVVLH